MMIIAKLPVLFLQDGTCLGAIVDAAEVLALASDPDYLPVDSSPSMLNVVSDGTDLIYQSRKGELAPCPVFVRAVWEAQQARVDNAIVALPADVLAAKFAGYKTEAEKKAERAAEREANALASAEAIE